MSFKSIWPILARICGISLALAVSTSAYAAVRIYSGSVLPQQEGWREVSGAGHLPSSVQVENAQDGAVDVLRVETTGMQFHYYEYDSAYVQYLVTFRVRVDDATHNSFDAGFMISGVDSGWVGTDRGNGLYLESDRIGFMDDSVPAIEVEPRVYHDYSLLMLDDRIDVFVDAAQQSILDGVAVPVLSRAIRTPSDGVIRFGDQTNDLDVNSRYSMEAIWFTPISLVPEPTCAVYTYGWGLLCGILSIRSLNRSRLKAN